MLQTKLSSPQHQRTDTAIDISSSVVSHPTSSIVVKGKSINGQPHLGVVKVPKPIVHSVPLSPKTWHLKGSGFSETETFYIWPETGGFILFQLAYSEVIRIAATQITLRVELPDYSFFKSYSLSGHTIQSLENGAWIQCEALNIKKSILKSNQLQIQVMHHTKDYALEWTFVFPFALLQLDQDGTVHFGDPIGGLHQVFGLKAKVQGQFQDKRNKSSHSLCGEGTFVHQYQETSPHKIANRWQFINFVSPHLSMVTISGLTPKALHQETFGTLALHYLDPITQTYHSAVSSHIEYSFLNTLKDTPTNYLVPQQLEVQAHLTNDNGEPLLLTLHFANLNFNQVFRVNVLNELPWLVRKAIQLLFANPVVYQFLEQVSLKLQKKDSNVILAEVSGSAIFELTYTNEV